MKINCIAVDDEPLALEIISSYCSKVPFLSLLGTFNKPLEALSFMTENKVELLFLDIQMEELTGIQLLSSLKVKPFTILTTAYDNYALQGFDLDVIDYLLKPISFDRFLKGVNKVMDRIHPDISENLNNSENSAILHEESYFFVKTETRMERIEKKDILYVEGMGDYWRIVTRNKRIMTLMNAKKIEDILHEPNFCRVHKSFFAAIDKIESIERKHIKVAEQRIPISETYEKKFFDLIEKNKMA
jgi:two-component system, LytTR family, response regulator